MHSLEESRIDCPYCGESIVVLIDDSDSGSEYIEDCQVCCRPIVFRLTVSSMGETTVSVRAEEDTF